MAFNRPTLEQLVDRIQADLQSRLGSQGSVLRRSVVSILSRVFAGASHSMHAHLDWIFRQVFIDTAESENLERHASTWGVLRKAATYAYGVVGFTGSEGSSIPAGTLLKRSDGSEYTTDQTVVISGGVASVNVTATTAGAAGNTAAGSKLNLITPIAGVNGAATVASGTLNLGEDEESDDDLRLRILKRIQSPPHGGSASDYETWALEVAGVTRAWPYPKLLGPGTIGLTFVMDDKIGTIIPNSSEVALVQNHIDLVKPVDADVTVYAPTAVPLNFTIALTPNNAEVRANVIAELKDLLRRLARPGGTIYISQINEAISIASGESDHVLSLPATNVVRSANQITTMGSITWL